MPISDERAREIAREWHSPSPHDRAITALSHGVPYPLGELALEADRLLREHPSNMDVQALFRWVQDKQSQSTCPACRGEDPYEDHTYPGGCHSPRPGTEVYVDMGDSLDGGEHTLLLRELRPTGMVLGGGTYVSYTRVKHMEFRCLCGEEHTWTRDETELRLSRPFMVAVDDITEEDEQAAREPSAADEEAWDAREDWMRGGN